VPSASRFYRANVALRVTVILALAAFAGCGSSARTTTLVARSRTSTYSDRASAGHSPARPSGASGANTIPSGQVSDNASLSHAPQVSGNTPEVSGKVNGADSLPAAAQYTKVASGAVSDAEIRKEIAKERKAGIILPSGNTAQSFEQESANVYAPGGGDWAFPIQPLSLVLASSTWTQDQGVDMATAGGACGNAAVEVAITSGTVVQVGIAGFGSYAPVIHIDAGPFRGWFVYYGHAAPALVQVGAHVIAGQPIAEVGCGIVGLSSGPHLEIGLTPPGSTPCCPGWQVTSPAVDTLMQQIYARSRH
jgi:murein DD-endopeptidase MepM/ murein hydrolase activator NlpD